VARKKLLAGPARAVRAISFWGSEKFAGFTGTGFPQPKPKRRRNSIPNGSVWARGSRVSLPERRGVGSPSFVAAQLWAYSWMDSVAIAAAAQIRVERSKIIWSFIASSSSFWYYTTHDASNLWSLWKENSFGLYGGSYRDSWLG